ncbi:MAG TPA: acyl carrier protein [Chloroflexota bacterium]|jgi:diaminopimelate decarboxylase/acyl carrier protein
MDRNTVVSTVKSVLADIIRNPAVLDMSENTSLRDGLGVDSMTSLTFLMALEDNIAGFMVDADSLEPDDFRTIGTISDYVMRQVAPKSATMV